MSIDLSDPFDELFGECRGADRPLPWWRSASVPASAVADWLDDALADGHHTVALTVREDGCWIAVAIGGASPMRAGGRQPGDADWLLTWAPQSHAVSAPDGAMWAWRLGPEPSHEPSSCQRTRA